MQLTTNRQLAGCPVVSSDRYSNNFMVLRMAKPTSKKKAVRKTRPVGPEFLQDTVDTLAARSAMICNHCGCLTVGPSDARGDLKLKLGEAAHIRAQNDRGARYDASMTDAERSAISNGIWLCANCHTMVDKNEGAGFPAAMLENWKATHEGVLSSLLRTHRSPLPMLRRITDEGSIAQDAVDILEQHGALFVDDIYEVDDHVSESIRVLRNELKPLSQKVKYDEQLKDVLKQVSEATRVFMNKTSAFPLNVIVELHVLRTDVGVILLRLRDEFGCVIRGNLNKIVPPYSGSRYHSPQTNPR